MGRSSAKHTDDFIKKQLKNPVPSAQALRDVVPPSFPHPFWRLAVKKWFKVDKNLSVKDTRIVLCHFYIVHLGTSHDSKRLTKQTGTL